MKTKKTRQKLRVLFTSFILLLYFVPSPLQINKIDRELSLYHHLKMTPIPSFPPYIRRRRLSVAVVFFFASFYRIFRSFSILFLCGNITNSSINRENWQIWILLFFLCCFVEKTRNFLLLFFHKSNIWALSVLYMCVVAFLLIFFFFFPLFFI